MEKLQAMKEEYKAKLKADGETAVKEALKDFFDANPIAEALRWHQFTPSFNDGEPCRFSVHEFFVRIPNPSEDDISEHDDGFVWPQDEVLSKGLSDLYDACYKAKDAMEAVFGDNSRVTVSRDGSTTIDHYQPY